MGRSRVEVRQGEGFKGLLSRGAIREEAACQAAAASPRASKSRSPFERGEAKQAQGRASAPARAAASASAPTPAKIHGRRNQGPRPRRRHGDEGQDPSQTPFKGDLRLCQRRFKGFQSHRGRGISLYLPEG